MCVCVVFMHITPRSIKKMGYKSRHLKKGLKNIESHSYKELNVKNIGEINKYTWFSFFVVVMFYKVAWNTELTNAETLLLVGVED